MRRWSELSPFTRGCIQGTVIGYAIGVFLTLCVVSAARGDVLKLRYTLPDSSLVAESTSFPYIPAAGPKIRERGLKYAYASYLPLTPKASRQFYLCGQWLVSWREGKRDSHYIAIPNNVSAALISVAISDSAGNLSLPMFCVWQRGRTSRRFGL